MPDDAVQERIDDLETTLNEFCTERRNIQQHEIEPSIQRLRSADQEARDHREELDDRVERLENLVARFASQLETLHGVSNPDDSNPQKRLVDTAQALIRRAEARSDATAGTASMSMREVQDMLADAGHGEVPKPSCYKAMRDLYDEPGFSEGSKSNANGREVECVRVNLEGLPADGPGNNVTTGEPATPPDPSANYTGEVTTD